jgi:hypothetical protein
MFGKEYEKYILKIPMSHNTVSRHVQYMSQEVESQVVANIKEAYPPPPPHPVGQVNWHHW